MTPDTPQSYTLSSLTAPSEPPPGARPASRHRVLVACLAVAAVLLVGIGGLAWYLSQPSTMSVHGTVSVPDATAGIRMGDPCTGSDLYADIQAGAQVTITDAGTTTVAIAHLGEGSIDNDGCTFPWTASVPAGKGFYGIAVGNHQPTKVPEAEMRQAVRLSVS